MFNYFKKEMCANVKSKQESTRALIYTAFFLEKREMLFYF